MKKGRLWATGIAPLCVAGMMLCAVISCCPSAETSLGILPVRELEHRYEADLPLDSSSIDSIIQFHANGGSREDRGFSDELPDTSLSSFLWLFGGEHSGNLVVSTFETSTGVRRYIDPQECSYNIVNSCDDRSPAPYSRRAYLYHGYYYIFVIDEDMGEETDEMIPDDPQRFSRLIVMKDFEVTGEK